VTGKVSQEWCLREDNTLPEWHPPQTKCERILKFLDDVNLVIDPRQLTNDKHLGMVGQRTMSALAKINPDSEGV